MTAIGPLVVIGESLAAGMGDFSVHAETQRWSFPAQLAAALGLPFDVPLVEAPGIHAPAGYRAPAVGLPLRSQTAVFETLPPPIATHLAIPGYTLRDALCRRPCEPLIQPGDPTQTACNLFLGARTLAGGSRQGLTQAEFAARWSPAAVLVCLGYQEAVDALVYRDLARVPDAGAFAADYTALLDRVGPRNGFVLFTVPNPCDTAYCCGVADAADACAVDEDALRSTYGLDAAALVTCGGLNEIAYQIFAREITGISRACLVPIDFAARLEDRIAAVNDVIRSIARDRDAAICDLHALFARVSADGLTAGNQRITSRYLGGFFRLNGLYPGFTGHAAIANAVLDALREHGVHCAPIDLGDVAARDPVAQYEPAVGHRWNAETLRAMARRLPQEDRRPSCSSQARAHRAGELTDRQAGGPLRLPPDGVLVLPIDSDASYFGDGISPVNASHPVDVQWGTGGDYLFGGLAMVDSHLHGHVRIEFDEPQNGRCGFRLSLGDLDGDDAVLTAPHLFRMAFRHTGVSDVAGVESRGTVDLETGEVFDLEVYAQFRSDALGVLVGINPTFPRQPLTFPGAYGSAWARFDQQPGGRLEFTFYGTTFVPLGPDIRWPLNFSSADGSFASIPAAGTTMHPHLHLSTRPPARESSACDPAIPENEIRELTLYTHNSAFGDQFTLDVAQLGGYAKGRSHVLGRLHIQFGPRCGNSIPIAVACLRPGGVLSDLPPSPITAAFPARLYPGAQGFYEYLRFPTRTYALDDLAIIDDPFDIAMAAVDVTTGRSINDVLHRGFIHQDLIFALLRVEPRTPKSSFLFRGPCAIENGPSGDLTYRFKGIVRVPYPAGFLFPQPDLSTAFVVGPESVLDPFLWFQAGTDITSATEAQGAAREMVSSLGETFSYRYSISRDGSRPPEFEYENHSQGGRFVLHALTSASFTRSRAGSPDVTFDTVTIAGFGIWSKDGHESLQQVAAQFSTSAEAPYVGIQIDLGSVSNVNTKPAVESLALP